MNDECFTAELKFFLFLAPSQVSSASAKSLAMDSAEIKALGENMTSFHQAVVRTCIINVYNKANCKLGVATDN